MNTCFCFDDPGTVNVFLYQPIPPRNAPPPFPVGLVESNGNSMLQSWGKSIFLHLESSKFAASALIVLSFIKRQSASNRIERAFCACADKKHKRIAVNR